MRFFFLLLFSCSIVACQSDLPSQYEASWDSLQQYETADWIQDDKLGIFIHWGPYAVPAFGNEWYPRRMYLDGDVINQHHVDTYGKLSDFGYKDFIPRFTAEHWDPQAWADLFKASGARYVVPVAEHHDGFALYNSSHTPWNSLSMGPKRDILGELGNACRQKGLKVGASSHYAHNWNYYSYGEDLDTSTPSAQALYGAAHGPDERPSTEFVSHWYKRTQEIIDEYEPDLLWFDFGFNEPEFEQARQEIAAYYYNQANIWNKEVVLNYKWGAFPDGAGTLDIERGRLSHKRKLPWQTDTSVGKKSWGYIEGEDYKSVNELIDVFIDIISKNGHLLLNINPRADGSIPEQTQEILREMGAWLDINGEAVYGSRPWEIFGEGPTRVKKGEAFGESQEVSYTRGDIRYTQKDGFVYAFILDWPGETVVLRNIEAEPDSELYLLGYEAPLSWTYDAHIGLIIELPVSWQDKDERACEHAYVLKLKGSLKEASEAPQLLMGQDTIKQSLVLYTDNPSLQLVANEADEILWKRGGEERFENYQGIFRLDGAEVLHAYVADSGKVYSEERKWSFQKIKGIRQLLLEHEVSPQYPGLGPLSLVDGNRGDEGHSHPAWLGWEGEDLVATFALEEVQEISTLQIRFLVNQGLWIFSPVEVQVLISKDGETYTTHTQMLPEAGEPQGKVRIETLELPIKQEALFVKVIARSLKECPDWHAGKGGKAWVFCDELVWN